MKIHTKDILRSFVFLMLVAFSSTLFVAQAADVLAAESNDEILAGQQDQTQRPVGDAKQSQPLPVPSGITLRSTLVRDINDSHARLEQQTPGLKDELTKLKQSGRLDRRTKRDIEGCLRQAHSILSRLRRVLQTEQLGEWQARNIAQELNYQGDRLDSSLKEWRKNLSVAGDGTPTTDSENKKALQKQQQLIQTLSDIGRMLHDIGNAIVQQAQ